MAKEILSNVGNSIRTLLNKDEKYLKNELKLSDSIISTIFFARKMVEFYNFEELIENKKLNNIPKIAKYFQVEIGSRETEHIMVLFLNSGQKFIKKKIFGDNNISITSFNTENLITDAKILNAKYVFISHNHPSGDVQPSLEDKKAMATFCDTLKNVTSFELMDHIIVSGDKYFSFTENNIMPAYRKNVLMLCDSKEKMLTKENKLKAKIKIKPTAGTKRKKS